MANPVRTLLIFDGTTEAAGLAREATERFGGSLRVITSLAGRLSGVDHGSLRRIAGEVREGGFGGAAGIVDYLREQNVDVVIDATHPFAAAISRHVHDACAEADVPRLMLLRPEWPERPGDRWLEAADMADAADLVARHARRAFLATGPGRLDAFSGVRNVWFLVRAMAPPSMPLPLAEHRVIVERPPFPVEHEQVLLREHRIDTLVTKQSGGPTDAKLTAAREAGLSVVMVRRPPLPPGDRVETVDQAIEWLG